MRVLSQTVVITVEWSRKDVKYVKGTLWPQMGW